MRPKREPNDPRDPRNHDDEGQQADPRDVRRVDDPRDARRPGDDRDKPGWRRRLLTFIPYFLMMGVLGGLIHFNSQNIEGLHDERIESCVQDNDRWHDFLDIFESAIGPNPYIQKGRDTLIHDCDTQFP